VWHVLRGVYTKHILRCLRIVPPVMMRVSEVVSPHMERRVSSEVDVVIGSKKLDQQAAPISEQ